MFAVAVFVSFVYLIANGALDWGPVKRSRRWRPRGDVDRPHHRRRTIRRVGLEGREADGGRQPEAERR